MKKSIVCVSLSCFLAASVVLSGCGDPEKVSQITPPTTVEVSTPSGDMVISTADASAVESTSESVQQEPELVDGTIHSPLTQTGLVYVTESRAFAPYNFAESNGDAYANMINTAAEKFGEGCNVYSILAPTSFAVCLAPDIQASVDCSDEAAAIDYVSGKLSERVNSVKVLDTLKKHNGEYIYFGTDHHWTQLGAYYSYLEFCSAKGIAPHELAQYNSLEFPGFLGLFYEYSNQDPSLAAAPDTVQVYTSYAASDMTVYNPDGTEYAFPIISDVSASDPGSKYSAFIGGDCALCAIHNPTLSDGSSCLLIKDSFGNAFAPFLIDHYENVFVLDPSIYTGSISQFVADHGISDVIFLNNVDQILSSAAEQIMTLL